MGAARSREADGLTKKHWDKKVAEGRSEVEGHVVSSSGQISDRGMTWQLRDSVAFKLEHFDHSVRVDLAPRLGIRLRQGIPGYLMSCIYLADAAPLPTVTMQT